jgi:xylan 1,4-beta-xylosidase
MESFYTNPIIPGFHPDPSICRVDSDYYLINSTFHYYPGVPIFHSRDLVNWKQLGHVLTRPEQLDLEGTRNSMGIYAPTLRYHQGRFYMITTNINKGFRNFYVWSENPAGPWSDPIWLDWPGIDPSLFFDDDGSVYLTGTNNFLENESQGIYQVEIDIDSGKLITERRLIWHGTGGSSPEGPHLYKIQGKYYLMISEGGTEVGHMVTIARSDKPYGSFDSNPANPILSHRSSDHAIQATGHADLVQAEDGSWWTVFLGIRQVNMPFSGRHHHLGRETCLAPVVWTEEGWPVIGDDGIVGEKMAFNGLQIEQKITWKERDDFDSAQFSPEWNFLRNPIEGNVSLEVKPGWVALNGSGTTLDDGASPAFVGRRQQHMWCEVSAYLSFTPDQVGEEAGLTVYMNERYHYEIALTKDTDGKRKIILRRRIGSLWKVENEQEVEGTEFILYLEADPSNYTFYWSKPYNSRCMIGSGECKHLSTEIAGGFTGVFFGLYATGNGKPCDKPAYFDWFNYVPIEN